MLDTNKLSDSGSTSKSIVISTIVHVVLFSGLTYILANHGPTATQGEYVDLGYQTFDEPPPVAKAPRPMRHQVAEKAPVEEKAPEAAAPKELQDDKGEVAGTQKEQKTNTVASDQNGQATAVPYYKIKPKYPPAALVSGVEGWVLLAVDVTESGSVENVRVVDGKERNMFQTEAKRAVEQWKYKPFTDPTGKPITKRDHQVRVDFKLEEAGS